MPAFRLWALLVSLAIHGAFLLLLLHASPEGAQDLGVGGIEVALSPAGSAAGSIAAVEIPAAPTPDPVETARPIEATEAPVASAPDAVAQVPPDQAVPIPPAVVERARAPEPSISPAEEASGPAPDALPPVPPEEAQPAQPDVAETAPEEAEPAPPEVAEAAPAPEPATSPADEARGSPPLAADVPPDVPEAAQPEPPPDPAASPAIAQARSPEAEAVPAREATAVLPSPAKPAPPEDSRTAAAAPAEPAPAEAMSDPGAAGRAGMGEQAAVGADAGGAGGGEPGISPDYLDVLRAWLERHKQYPRQARLRRQEGTALLRFVIDRDGRVLSYRIERSSGHASLDTAVEAMLERAHPLPAMPPEMAQAQLELSLPVTFELR